MVLRYIRKSKKDREAKSKIMREMAPYLTLGWQIALTIGLGSLLGWWLDKKYDTNPTWLIICSLLGVIVGMYSFFKTVLTIEKEKKNKKRKLNG